VLERIAELLGLPSEAPHLERALTHPSFANERRDAPDNQRLEFLGDAILGFCVSELLYARFADADEGTLTRMRAQLVNAEALAAWARREHIAEALRLGRGAEAARLRQSTNVLADAVEALIAAAFLDAGIDAARRLCAEVVKGELESLTSSDGRDPKSALQERVQSSGGNPPTYRVSQSGGPAHDRWFVVDVLVEGEPVAAGRGRSKRLAERAAAAAALDLPRWRSRAAAMESGDSVAERAGDQHGD
jgi:ribonuclease-3